MPLDFPNPPLTNGQTWTGTNGAGYVWNGSYWALQPGAGGPFLPLSGGTMTGPLNVTATGGTTSRSVQDRWRNLRTPRDWGAVGDGTTDDTAAFQAAFTQLGSEGGGRLFINGSFYIASAVSVPSGIELFGDFAPTSMQYSWGTSYFQAPGSKLILGGGITMGRACILRNIMFIANNLPRSNPTNLTQANALIAQMAGNGTGVTLSQDNCLLDSVQVLGFNYGIYATGDPASDRHMLRNIHGDNINGIWMASGGDTTRIQGVHFWPYLTVGTGNLATYVRNGVGIYLGGLGATFPVAQATCYGYQSSFQADGCGAVFTQCWADGVGNANSAGYLITGAAGAVSLAGCIASAQQFGIHHSATSGAPVHIAADCALAASGPGGSTPATGMCIAVYADGHGHVVSTGAYYGGGPQAIWWLGPNTGNNVIIGNVIDDAASNIDHVWNVDPAVQPLLTKHSNRIINTTRGFTEQTTGTVAMGGVAVYDQMPQGLNSTPVGATTPSTGAFTTLSSSGAVSGAGFTGLLAPYAPLANPTFTGMVNANRLGVVGNNSAGTGAALLIQNAGTAAWALDDTSQGADAKVWDFFTSASTLLCRAVNDANSAATNWLAVTRTGYVPQQITLTAPTITLAGAVAGNNINANGHLTFSALAANANDLTYGLQLWAGYGINAYNAAINLVVNSAAVASFTNTGLNGCAIGAATPASGVFTSVGTTGAVTVGAGGPTITSGSAAPAATQPAGSIYMRTAGASGTRLYVSAGGGTWAAVAGV